MLQLILQLPVIAYQPVANSQHQRLLACAAARIGRGAGGTGGAACSWVMTGLSGISPGSRGPGRRSAGAGTKSRSRLSSCRQPRRNAHIVTRARIVSPLPAHNASAAEHRTDPAPAQAQVDAADPASALIVLAALDHLSGERDCERLHASMLAILADASGAEEVVLHRPDEDHFEPALAARGDGAVRLVDADGPWPVPASLVDAAHSRLAREQQGFGSMMLGESLLAHGLNDNKGLSGIITLRYPAAVNRPWWINSFLKVYQNHVNLITDAECDTLTGLFNRKTFESRINRILAMQRIHAAHDFANVAHAVGG
jgi:hypothetical protein